ncbi:MAG: hypothetical protein HKN01_07490, partial [Acidimicrobiia bacterium]|nr:hypothetical protein [Acidimicrobiia bacterium]
MKSDIQQRLGALSIELDDQVMDRQLAAIETALTAPPAPVAKPRRSWRYRLAPIAAGLTLFAAPAAAVAAESTVPGDLHYPVKQVTEQVRSWFDPGIVVEHRLEELETVLDRDAADDVVSD